MDERIIKGEADVAKGAAWLARAEPRFGAALGQIGTLPLRLKGDGFEALLSAIVSQQISVAASRGVWAKLEAAEAIKADAILALSVEELRAIGLSRQKAGYAKALAEHRIDFAGLRCQRSEAVVLALTEVKGIGKWTAEIYCMFSLGRADILAAGDLALQESARVIFDLPARPTEKELRKMAEAWSPWRAVAARLLFSYYHLIKDREGMT
ncbi:MAG: DNA-3-methyladenine glycosylase 2 family protein [Rhodobacteraceae bacterium]|nr:DNA-3-methyladenine glycosylase 2 family protein [Paracoccaceae bacterium]